MEQLNKKANYPSLIIGMIIGATLICIVVMWMNSRPKEAPEYVDLGYSPEYPIHVFLSDTADPGQIQEIVLDPHSARLMGLCDWLGGIRAKPLTRDNAPTPFLFEAWKKKPTPQTAILVQHHTDPEYQHITKFHGWHIYKEIDPGHIKEGYLSKYDRRSPFFELKMLVP